MFFYFSCFSCAYSYFLHTMFNGEDSIVILFVAEFCNKMILAAREVSATFVFDESVFYILKCMCFIIKHMNCRRRENGLFGAVIHTEYFEIGLSWFGNLFDSLCFVGCIHCFCFRNDFKCHVIRYVREKRSICAFGFIGSKINFIKLQF